MWILVLGVTMIIALMFSVLSNDEVQDKAEIVVVTVIGIVAIICMIALGNMLPVT